MIAESTLVFRSSPAIRPGVSLPLIQTIELSDHGTVIGRAIWMDDGSPDGHVRLLDVFVDPKHRRRGHGVALIRTAIAEAKRLGQTLGRPPRRVSASVDQKRHIHARAMLTKLGFHHVGTLEHVLKDQDILIYLLGLD